MKDLIWKDTTPLKTVERGIIAAWRGDVNGCDIEIYMHGCCSGTWLLTCFTEGIINKVLHTSDIEAAKVEAVKFLAEKIKQNIAKKQEILAILESQEDTE